MSESDDLVHHLKQMQLPDHVKWAKKIKSAGYPDMGELADADLGKLETEINMPSAVFSKLQTGLRHFRDGTFDGAFPMPTGDLDSTAPVLAGDGFKWGRFLGMTLATLVVGGIFAWAVRAVVLATGGVVAAAASGVMISDCLDGDTMITMSDRSKKRIKEVKAGDRILSYNNGKFKVKHVLEVKEGTSVTMRRISLKDRAGKTSEIQATAGHPFFTKQYGGAVLAPEVGQFEKTTAVAKLTIGDSLVTRGGKLVDVVGISDVLPVQKTYNLIVDGPGLFFAEEILSHSGLPPAKK